MTQSEVDRPVTDLPQPDQPSPSQGPAMGHRLPWLVFGLFAAFYLLTASGRIDPGDEETMYRVTRNLVERGEWAIESETLIQQPLSLSGTLPSQPYPIQSTSASPGRGGQTYSKYGLGQSLAAIPLYLAGKALAPLFPGPDFQRGAKLLMAFFNPLITAATCALFLSWCLVLGYSRRTSLLLTATYGLSTMAWVYTKNYYAQPATTFCLLAAAYGQSRFRQSAERSSLGLTGACLGLAILFRPDTLIALPAFSLALLVKRSEENRPRHWLRETILFLTPLALALAANAWYNDLRFGSLFGSGYAEASWNNPLLYGLYGLLFSPGKGVFLYNPVILLSPVGLPLLGRRHRAEALLIAFLTLTYLLFYAPYNFWSGGWNWGPRFLLPLLPFLTLATAPLLEGSPVRGGRAVFALLAALGLIVQLPAILVDHSRYLMMLAEQYPEDFYGRSIHQPELSPVVRQWPVVLDVFRLWSRPETWHEVRSLLASQTDPRAWPGLTLNQASDVVIQQSEFFRLNVPDFWWLHLYLLGWPLPATLAVLLLNLIAAVTMGAAAGNLFHRHRAAGGNAAA
jgi:hypothetical protein